MSPVQSAFFDVFSNLASVVSGSVSSVLNGVIYTLSPTTNDNNDDINNTATALLQTVAKLGPGVLREATVALNSTAAEVESLRTSVLDKLQMTSGTPITLRNLMRLLQTFVDNLPRSSLEASGILPAVTQLVSDLNNLEFILPSSEFRAIVAEVEDIAVYLVSNFRNLNSLAGLPSSLVRLHDRLLGDLDDLIVVAGRLIGSKDINVDSAINSLINSVTILVDSVPNTLLSVHNVISNTILQLENKSTFFISQIHDLIQEKLNLVPAMLNSSMETLRKLVTVIGSDLNEAVNYNEMAVEDSIAYAAQMNDVATNLLGALSRQLQSALRTIHRSSLPAVNVIIGQLKALANSTESGIVTAITGTENNLFSTFEATTATIQNSLIRGTRNADLCVNYTLTRVAEISQKAVESLNDCALDAVESTVTFIDRIQDQVDDVLMGISRLADKLDDCSGMYNTTQIPSPLRISSCFQATNKNIRQSTALSSLSTVQNSIAKMINSLYETIHTCVYAAIFEADDAGVGLERTLDKCFVY